MLSMSSWQVIWQSSPAVQYTTCFSLPFTAVGQSLRSFKDGPSHLLHKCHVAPPSAETEEGAGGVYIACSATVEAGQFHGVLLLEAGVRYMFGLQAAAPV